MASSPDFKVYFEKEYIAACKHVEDAAALVAFRGDGATIRWGRSARLIMWREGQEKQPAAESYDYVSELVFERMAAHTAKLVMERERRNLLEKLLRDAQELSEDSPERKLTLPAILQAIAYEKRGEHDRCDETLMVLKLRLMIGVAS